MDQMMHQMMHGKLVMDNWAADARLESTKGLRRQDRAGRRQTLARWVRSLLRTAGHGLSMIGVRLERHSDLRQPGRVEQVGRSS